MEIGVNTGMGISEVLNLKWRDVDLDNDRIHVNNPVEFRTKYRRSRVVVICSRL